MPESRFHLIRGKRRKHLRLGKAIHRPRVHEKLTAFVELESLIGAFFFACRVSRSQNLLLTLESKFKT